MDLAWVSAGVGGGIIFYVAYNLFQPLGLLETGSFNSFSFGIVLAVFAVFVLLLILRSSIFRQTETIKQ